MPCGYIKIDCTGCIYGEILAKSTVFNILGGAFAPRRSNAAPPLSVVRARRWSTKAVHLLISVWGQMKRVRRELILH